MNIRLIDPESQDVLEIFELNELDSAYERAEFYESQGLSVEIDLPSTFEQLGQMLGAKKEEIDLLRQEYDEEIDEHNN